MVSITLSSHFSSSKTLLKNPLPTPEASVVEYLKQLILKIIKAKLPTSKKSKDFKPVAFKDIAAKASRLKFKTVDKLYVFNSTQVLVS